MANDPKQYGEGNYEATRNYNERTKRFIESGRVEQAAEDAKPENEREAAQMRDAEAVGRSRAKDEDPALLKGNNESGTTPPAGTSRRPKP